MASACKGAKRQAKAQAAHHDHNPDNNDYNINGARGRKSKARCRVARTSRYSPQDFDIPTSADVAYDGMDNEVRGAKAGEGAPKAA